MNSKIQLIKDDCLNALRKLTTQSLDIVITSPPYNLNIKYNQYNDNKKRNEYLCWLNTIFIEISRTLKDNGAFFLNVGASSIDPWIYMDVANIARQHFILQNDITWVKSIAINGTTSGHFKPINSNRFLNNTFEHIFHFTKTGMAKINRQSIGVPYTDKTNVSRWKHNNTTRCRGNTWFIPYDTIQSKEERGNHPAPYPELLVEWCIKLHGYNSSTIVCDPFAGSGTTLVVANQLGISAIGIEIDSKYIDYIKRRLGNE